MNNGYIKLSKVKMSAQFENLINSPEDFLELKYGISLTDEDINIRGTTIIELMKQYSGISVAKEQRNFHQNKLIFLLSKLEDEDSDKHLIRICNNLQCNISAARNIINLFNQ